MNKICPKCRRKQENPAHLGCETCHVPFVDANELVTNFTRDELKVIAGFLLKDWRVYVVAGIFLAVGVGLLYWQVHEGIRTQIGKFQSSASNQVITAYSMATNRLDKQFQIFAQEASNQIAQAYSSVTNQIADEFQTPRIKETVEGVAKGEARSILEGEVQPVVYSFREDALFIRTVARAQAYDFKAYQRLLEIGTQTNDNAQLAKQVVVEIDRSLERERSEFSPRRTYMTFKGTNFYGGPFGSDELALRFSSVANDKTSFNREGFVNTVSDLKDPLFLSSLVELFTNETDLVVADRLTMAISDLAKENFHPHDFERITTWWKDHNNSFTNWPLSTLELGLHELNLANYPKAAEAFEQVLKLDSKADMSRAYAVACYWETGQTNRATTLAKEFKSSSARWAQWATAKAELEAGNVSNATVLFFSITTNFPNMSDLPDKRYHIYRHIDWQLYDKLIGTSTP
jgi:tetratricopeptide (TPR) repeat protein